MGAGKVSAREGSRWLGLTIKRVRDLTDPQSDGLDRFLARSNGSRLSGRRGTTVFPLLVHESYIEIPIQGDRAYHHPPKHAKCQCPVLYWCTA